MSISLIGKADSFIEAIKESEKIAKTDCPICLLGESGVGKEIFARFIHEKSSRSSNPFIPLNCGAFPKDLIESELFGHEKGAFTGASKDRKGVFEVASKGTVFLDEIGDLPKEQQIKFLRILESKTVTRIGSEKVISLDFRLICATNKDLKSAVESGEFRPDLFYRIASSSITIPSLSRRKEDILLLADHFSRVASTKAPSSSIWESLKTYDWPGNVRELEAFVKKVISIYDPEEINPEIILRELNRHKELMPRLSNAEKKTHFFIDSVSRFQPYTYRWGYSSDGAELIVCGIADYLWKLDKEDRRKFLGERFAMSPDATIISLLADSIASVCIEIAETEDIDALTVATRDFEFHRMKRKRNSELGALERAVYDRLKNE